MAKKAQKWLKGRRRREKVAARGRPRAASSGTIAIGDVSFSATNISVRDRDGDILDPRGMSIGSNITFGGEWDANPLVLFNRDPNDQPLTVEELRPRNAAEWFQSTIRSELDFEGISRDLAITGNAFVHKPPPELAELLALVADLQSIPPLEFVPWRERAAIVADWLEERSDERGTRLREAVTGKQDWDGFIGKLARHHSVFAEFMTVITYGGRFNGGKWRGVTGDNCLEVVAWVLAEFRWDILNRAGLGHCTRHPHGVQEDGGCPIPPWVARRIQNGEVTGVSVGWGPDTGAYTLPSPFVREMLARMDPVLHGDPTAPAPTGVINAPVETDRQRRRRETAGLPPTLLGRPVIVTEGEDRP